MKSDVRSHCPINFTVESFGDKWSLLIIRDLMFKGKTTYGEFLLSDEQISTNILADRLQRLEREGFIVKRRDEVKKSRFIYSLTELGKSLLPLMLELIAWGARNDPDTEASAEFMAHFERDREGLMREILEKL